MKLPRLINIPFILIFCILNSFYILNSWLVLFFNFKSNQIFFKLKKESFYNTEQFFSFYYIYHKKAEILYKINYKEK